MKKRLFGIESLENRVLFSAVAGDTDPLEALGIAPVVAAAVKHPHPVQGAFNVAGTYSHSIQIGNPDVGKPYEFNGTGKSTKLGTFTLTGWVQPPGFIANGKSYGKLWITNAKGSVILSVVGPAQNPGVLPPSLSFTVIKGHGEYVHAKGTGEILVSASESTQKFLFKFNQSA